ncbi:GDSL-type esterase/lipase family protein [Miniimonas sp. S16]|uniref:GDSL-type esterase/lipase family protein n=1 Tax=Miniimonas sp. S16 TaxID=2171623 RepID=UPI00131F29AB|nr:GDSL-type esterase/lipase family protein [Miniimonas sp. S16]
MRLFTIGDSLAAGVLEVGSPQRQRPFPDLLADLVRARGTAVTTANAARPSATLADARRRQAAELRAFRPSVAIVWVGLNDVLRWTFDACAVRDALEEVLDVVRAAGARPLTATMPRPGEVLGIPGWSGRRIGARVEALNEQVLAAGAARGAVVLDLGALVRGRRATAFGPDGVHLSPYGHALVAHGYLDLLERAGLVPGLVPGLVMGPEPQLVPADAALVPGRAWTPADRAAWATTSGAVYAARRAIAASAGRLGAGTAPDGEPASRAT